MPHAKAGSCYVLEAQVSESDYDFWTVDAVSFHKNAASSQGFVFTIDNECGKPRTRQGYDCLVTDYKVQKKVGDGPGVVGCLNGPKVQLMQSGLVDADANLESKVDAMIQHIRKHDMSMCRVFVARGVNGKYACFVEDLYDYQLQTYSFDSRLILGEDEFICFSSLPWYLRNLGKWLMRQTKYEKRGWHIVKKQKRQCHRELARAITSVLRCVRHSQPIDVGFCDAFGDAAMRIQDTFQILIESEELTRGELEEFKKFASKCMADTNRRQVGAASEVATSAPFEAGFRGFRATVN